MILQVKLITFLTLLIATNAFSQVNVESKETEIIKCLDDKVGEDNWKSLISYFESYLVENNFGSTNNIAAAYVKYIEYRTGYPSKPMPTIPERDALKKQLIELKIINSETTTSPLFLECYYQPNTDFEKYPKSTLKDVISIGQVLSQFDMSSGVLMGGLAEALKEKDLQKEIYKRAVYLLSIGEVIYVQEFVRNEAGVDNPVFRSIKQREQEAPLDAGVVQANDQRLERKPEPEGGMESYLKWIYDNNEKLAKPKSLGKFYRSIVRGTVDKEGNLVDIGVWRGIGQGYDEVAFRLVKTHPVRKWKTGTIGGKPVDVVVEIEVDFRKK